MKKEKINRDQILYYFILFVTCCVSGFVGGITAAKSETEYNPIYIELVFLLSVVIHILLHEFGHLAFGLASGYKFSSFRIGSIALVKQKGKLRLKRYSLAGSLGQCLLIPPDTDNDEISYVMYNLGGVWMNILISGITTLVFIASGFPEAWSTGILIFVFIGYAIAALNGIPLKPGEINNDGYNTLELKRSPKARRSLWIQMKINSLLVEGVRAKDMPEEWFEVPEKEDMKNSMISTMGVFACSRLMDMHKLDEAEKLTEELLSMDSAIIGIYRRLMICDLIYCKSIRGAAAEEINALFDKAQKKFMKSMKNYPSVIRTEYVLALMIENDKEKAEKQLLNFEKRAKKYPYPADIESERELIELADKVLSEANK